MNLVKRGSIVTYKLGLSDHLKKAVVQRIEVCRHDRKYGDEVDFIDLDYAPDANQGVLDLDDGHWVYAHQIREVNS